MNEIIIENYFKDTNKNILVLEEKYKDLEEKLKHLEKIFFDEKFKNETSYYTTCYVYYERFKFVRFILFFIVSKSLINDPRKIITYYNILRNIFKYYNI
jgi:hypothetical protein